LVTNEDYQAFTLAGGYVRDEFWTEGARNRVHMLVTDGETNGPGGWVRGDRPAGKNRHPVTGICFYEAQAFVLWLNREAPVPGWRWTLPPEDMWEYAARTETGLTYPWGDAFEQSRCNSREAGIGDTSQVDQFGAGASRQGCRDMAGNVWEFVIPAEGVPNGCVLRGGSYKNDRFEVRSYLRLFGVQPLHRPPDFGFRVAQTEITST
jgi:formylglycine-generating enzyme required for sulfatase activity